MKKRARTLKKKWSYPVYLTIDWDYFIPEDLTWDLSHKESQFYHSTLWGTRGHLIRKMVTTGEENDFWPRLWNKISPPESTIVTDSHLGIWDDAGLHLSRTVVIIDQHHDVFNDASTGKVDCANWLAAWLGNDDKRRAIWVKAPHTWEDEIPSYARRKITVLKNIENLPSLLTPIGCHICRSGAWTPPWLDGKFKKFVQRSGMKLYGPLGKDLVEDAISPRWTLKDYRYLFQSIKVTNKLLYGGWRS